MRGAAFAALLLALVLLRPSPFGCVSCDEGRWGYASDAFDHYVLGSVYHTPGGVSFDPSGQAVVPALIDEYVDEVEACLQRPIDRASFVVKIAGDWHEGCAGNPWGQQELLPVSAPDVGCEAKGLAPSADCPCEWRAGIRCPNVLVVTPNLLLLKDVLIRWTTGTFDPWSPGYATCATP